MNTKNNKQNDNYQADDIVVLEGLEAVRKRPGMYIGTTGQEGLHRCLGEIIDNSVDESMAGYASEIKVTLKQDSIIISDNGRGIPTDTHTKTGKSALETIMTILHAGGKFDQGNYQFSGGLHGVGASVVNALSEKMLVWVLRDDVIHYMEFAEGKTIQELQSISLSQSKDRFPELKDFAVWKKTGTVVLFKPDKNIFETTKLNLPKLQEALKQTAYLNKGLKITLSIADDEKSSKKNLFSKISEEEVKDMWFNNLKLKDVQNIWNSLETQKEE